MTKINVVLDIDECLSSHRIMRKEEEALYRKKGMVISALKTHFIFPGVKEFIQLLFKDRDINIHFFSAGPSERNTLFVEKLLTNSLGEEQYKAIKNHVVILSRNDLRDSVNELTSGQIKTFGLGRANKKKDLRKITENTKELSNTVLIDDNSSYVWYGQEKNLLHSPNISTIDRYFFKSNKYNENGYTKIDCWFYNTKKSSSFDEVSVVDKSMIYFIKSDLKYYLGYLDKQTEQYKQEEIPEHKCIELGLITSFNDFLKISDRSQAVCTQVVDCKQIEYIHEQVDHLGGYTERFCYTLNHICYVAGLFFKAKECAQKTDTPITEILFNMQFKKTGEYFKPWSRILACCDSIYQYGLIKLQEVNPQFSFTTPLSYHQCIELEIPKTVDKANNSCFLKEDLNTGIDNLEADSTKEPLINSSDSTAILAGDSGLDVAVNKAANPDFPREDVNAGSGNLDSNIDNSEVKSTKDSFATSSKPNLKNMPTPTKHSCCTLC